MSSDSKISMIEDRVRLRASRGDFMNQMILMASGDSADVQEEFVSDVTDLARAFRVLFDSTLKIEKVGYSPSSYWPSVKGCKYGFIDGGVASVDLPTAAPIGMRVGSYVVSPGVEGPDREEFNIEISMVDELFGANAGLYAEVDDDLEKLRDAARILVEIASGYLLIERNPELTGLLFHGPLINPVSPYGLEGFPPLTLEARNHLSNESDPVTGDDLGFIPIYLTILEKLLKSEVPVAGVVERSKSRQPVVVTETLKVLRADGDLNRADEKHFLEELARFGLKDLDVFDLVLEPGEFISPICVNRQGGDHKWPNYWKTWIRDFPPAYTTYLKVSENSDPFRIEAFENCKKMPDLISLILHTSRLLPRYGFPAGLDIVDKYAKVPSWMSRSVRGQHATVLLKRALESRDPKMISFAKRVLAARGRDWFFRPSA